MSKIHFIALILISLSAFSQPSIAWKKCVGGSAPDVGNSVQQTTDGGFIVAGYSQSNDNDVSSNYGSGDCWIFKTDPAGSIQWQRSYGGSSYDIANSIIQTRDGGYIFVGSSNSNDFDLTNNQGSSDYWIVKINSINNIEWQISLGGSSNDVASVIKQTADDGYIIAGYTESNNGDVNNNHGDKDYWIVRLDSSGILVWQKCFGGSGEDYATDVIQTADSCYLISGISMSNNGDVLGNPNLLTTWILKIDVNANILNQYCFGYYSDSLSGNTAIFTGRSIAQKSNQNFMVMGHTLVTMTFSHVLPSILEFDSSGNIINQRYFQTGAYDEYSCFEGRLTSDGGCVLGGYAYNYTGGGVKELFVLKISTAGLGQWISIVGGSPFINAAHSLMETADGGYIVTGETVQGMGFNCNPPVSDYALIKYVGTGVEVPNFNTKSDELVIEFNSLGNLFLTYTAVNSSDFNFEVSDIIGRSLLQGSFPLEPGINTKQLDLGYFASGLYIVNVSGAVNAHSIKLFKE